MIKLKATALIRSISAVIEIPSKSGGQPFLKRELVLDDSWTKDGKTYENLVLVEFTGDKMAQLDIFAPGQRVNVEGYVSGREYQGKVFNTIKGSTIELFQAQQPAPSTGQYPQAPGGYPQQPQYPQAPGYPQQGTYPPRRLSSPVSLSPTGRLHTTGRLSTASGPDARRAARR